MPMKSPGTYQRRSARLRGYDYTQPGAYFVTICTCNRECLFGEIVSDQMHLNEWGDIVQDEWVKTGIMRSHVKLDIFVVMPNHVHGIIVLNNDVGATRRVALCRASHRLAPTMSRANSPASGSIGTIVGQFKSMVTKRISRMSGYVNRRFWQRNYYEHIVRNEDELNKIREYMQNNPLKWHLDRENPERVGSDKLEDEIFPKSSARPQGIG